MQHGRGSYHGSKSSSHHGSRADRVQTAAWVKQHRNTAGAFDPPPLQGRLTLDAVLEDSRRTARLCHNQLQDDLDLLHEQVHAEIHSAVTQELQGVAQSISKARREAMDELQNSLANDLGPLTEELRRVLEEDIGPLRARVDELYYDRGTSDTPRASEAEEQWKPLVEEAVKKEMAPLHDELAELRHQTREIGEQGPKAAQEIAQVLQAVQRSAREAARSVVQEEVQATLGAAREAATEALAEANRESKALVDQQVARLDRANVEEAAAIRNEIGALAEKMAEEVVSFQKQVDSRLEDAAGELQVECAERIRLATALDGMTRAVDAFSADSQRALEQLEHLAKLGEARFRDAQEAVADLEQRVRQRQASAIDVATSGLTGRIDAIGDAVSALSKVAAELGQNGRADVQEELYSLQRQCLDDLRLARASWVRVVEWTAEVDVDSLREDGKASVSSPIFSAACLNGLQLRLRIVESSKGWAYGVFLSAPAGQVSFRLHVAGKSHTFEGVEFSRSDSTSNDAETPEWGSPRIVVLHSILGPKVPVKLEIIDVVVQITSAEQGGAGIDDSRDDRTKQTDGVADSNVNSFQVRAQSGSPQWPHGLRGYAKMADEAHVAAREAAAIRASLVRRVEWRVTRVSDRVEAARRAYSGNAPMDDDALEPLVSPAFSAAGLDGLQLQLFPLGYRPKGDEMCGLFLTCPRGVFVRCRVFVGDAFRTFEHEYETKEPYGRQGMCRLVDKIASDDSVLCGIEFLEVKQESHAQIKSGPFGHVADQVKVVLSPGGGGMEAVRELTELRGLGAEGAGAKERRAARVVPESPSNDTVVAPHGQGRQRLARGGKSLPALKAGHAGAAGPVGGAHAGGPGVPDMGRGRRQMDM